MARITPNQMKLRFKTEFHHNLDPNDEIVQFADLIDWDLAERLYATTFSQSDNNNNSKDGRIAFRALIFQQRFSYSDKMLIWNIKTNPYFQYFLRLLEFKHICPSTDSTLVQFRKRITP